jgi:hypothetical protein
MIYFPTARRPRKSSCQAPPLSLRFSLSAGFGGTLPRPAASLLPAPAGSPFPHSAKNHPRGSPRGVRRLYHARAPPVKRSREKKHAVPHTPGPERPAPESPGIPRPNPGGYPNVLRAEKKVKPARRNSRKFFRLPEPPPRRRRRPHRARDRRGARQWRAVPETGPKGPPRGPERSGAPHSPVPGAPAPGTRPNYQNNTGKSPGNALVIPVSGSGVSLTFFCSGVRFPFFLSCP